MAKHIGIVACSAEGAALCYQTICKEAAEKMGEHKHPEISMHTFPLSQDMEHIRKDNWNGVTDLMIASSLNLKASGAEFLICPDNTIHQAFEDVESRSPLSWLHIAREVAREAVGAGYKKSALLGTKYLMMGPVYPKAWKEVNLELVIPTQAVRDRIDSIIFNELVYGKIKRESRKYFLAQIRILKGQGCDSVILGCTEIPLLVTAKDSRLPILDSTRILARAALKHSLET
jgi:aspartate racemase